MNKNELVHFFQKEHMRLTGFVRSLLHDAETWQAEDMVWDLLANLLGRANLAVPLEQLAAYIFRALRNRLIDQYRTAKPTISLDAEIGSNGETLLDFLASTSPDSQQIVLDREQHQVIFAALKRLSEVERDVVICHEFEGMSFQELAQQWDIPIGTLLSHKSRALKKLRKYLADYQQE